MDEEAFKPRIRAAIKQVDVRIREAFANRLLSGTMDNAEDAKIVSAIIRQAITDHLTPGDVLQMAVESFYTSYRTGLDRRYAESAM